MFDITLHIGDKNVTIMAHGIYLLRLIISFTLKSGFHDIANMAKLFV